MEKYYFTFDTIDADLNFKCENSDYIVIMAHSYTEAVQIYRKNLPDEHEGIVNCANIYTEDEWIADGICKRYGERYPGLSIIAAQTEQLW